MKPKSNYSGSLVGTSLKDLCQTPAYALKPLLPYIKPEWHIWEPAAADGFLARAIFDMTECSTVETDITHIVPRNFFEWEPPSWDALITNPPYSIKYQWMRRCYDLGKPWALLMPLETLGTEKAQVLFAEHGVEIIVSYPRINFYMPNKGWDGGGAQFPVAWFTHGFEIGSPLTFYGRLEKE